MHDIASSDKKAGYGYISSELDKGAPNDGCMSCQCPCKVYATEG